MITDICQRFTLGRESRRPAGEVIKPSAFDVVECVGSDADAVAFVEKHHYSGSCSARSHVFKLYMRGELVGASVFGMSASMAALDKPFPTLTNKERVELGRFVLIDSVPGNGESWFLARCFEAMRGRVVGVVSLADPEPRTSDVTGQRVFPGHVGCIYQATNGAYVGKSNPQSIRMFPDGTVFSNVSSGKIRQRKTGWRYAASQLEAWGASPFADDATEDQRIAWLERWRAQLTRGVRHRGNHRYLWCLDRRRRREVLRFPTFPYPKLHS